MRKYYAAAFTLGALIAGAAMTTGATFAQSTAPAAETPAAEAPPPAAQAPAPTAETPAPAPAAEAPPPAANTPAAMTGAEPAKPPKAAVAKPRKKTAPKVVIQVTNQRAVPLTELDATPAGGAEAKQIVANLAPGKKTSVTLAHGKSCVFDLHGAFDDGSSTDMTSVDLCKDNKVNLVD
ncbi:MAG: hypothetical protein ABSE69_11215 [Roseiarcus sp.]|jgi:hypothetical protein